MALHSSVQDPRVALLFRVRGLKGKRKIDRKKRKKKKKTKQKPHPNGCVIQASSLTKEDKLAVAS